MLTAEAFERMDKFEPWLLESPTGFLDDSPGLRTDAPEEARKAYAEYCTEEKSRMEKGIKA